MAPSSQKIAARHILYSVHVILDKRREIGDAHLLAHVALVEIALNRQRVVLSRTRIRPKPRLLQAPRIIIVGVRVELRGSAEPHGISPIVHAPVLVARCV